MDKKKNVQPFYYGAVEKEWARIENRPEFLLTTRFMDRYINPGDSVLDIGGGPGRYSLYLAKKGCDVTLFDLSFANVDFAQAKAKELSLPLVAMQGDACYVNKILPGKQFGHVLLMGPMYHLLAESERKQAVEAAISLLKPDGILYVSFISIFAGFVHAMKFLPEVVLMQEDQAYINAFLQDVNYAGKAFTQAFYIKPQEVLSFMGQFQLKKLHFFGQEGIFSPGEPTVMQATQAVIDRWLEISEQTCERAELLCLSEHCMFIGKK